MNEQVANPNAGMKIGLQIIIISMAACVPPLVFFIFYFFLIMISIYRRTYTIIGAIIMDDHNHRIELLEVKCTTRLFVP